MPIIWQMTDGRVRVMNLQEDYLQANQRPGESTADAVLRLADVEQAKVPSLRGAMKTLATKAEVTALDRKRRSDYVVRDGKITVRDRG